MEDETPELHRRRQTLFQEAQNATKGSHVVINRSAPLRVEDRQEFGGDVGLVCLPKGHPLCEIASRWPVLVFAQAGTATIYYRLWDGREYSDLQPITDFYRVTVSGDVSRVPDPPARPLQQAFDVFWTMHETRDERASKVREAEANPDTFVGTVVQADSPIILDDGDRMMTIEGSEADLALGQTARANGRIVDSGTTTRITAKKIESVTDETANIEE